jgi:ligand-binding sensor domain-containing protein
MFRCLIRSSFGLFFVLAVVAGADTKSGWKQFARCQTVTCQAFDDSACWIGTDACGLARLSPLSGEMTYFTNQNSPLPSNSVRCLAIGPSGVKWIGTDEGLARFDGALWSIFRTDNAPMPSNSVSCLALDDSGNVWVGFTSGGVVIHSKNGWTDLLQKRPGFPLALTYNTVRAIAPANDHDAWISWNAYYSGSFGFAFLDASGWHAYGYAGVLSMAFDRDSAVWFQYFDYEAGQYNVGLARLRYPDAPAKYRAPRYLLGKYGWESFSSVVIDDADRKWVCAANLVGRLSDTVWTALPLIEDTVSIKGTVSAIAFDKTRRAWAAFNRADDSAASGPEVACLSDSNAWTRYPVRGSGIPFNDVRYVCLDQGGGAWIESSYHVARFHSGQWERFPSIDSMSGGYYDNSVCPDGHGGIWIAKNIGFIHVDGREWKVHPFAAADSFKPVFLFSGDPGRLWAGMEFVSGIGYSLVAFDTLMNVIEKKDSLTSIIGGMARTPDGTLWVYIYYNGLFRRASNGTLDRVTTLNSSLPSDAVTGILCGPNGNLWVGTEDAGLACFSNGRWTTFDTLSSDIPGQYTKPLCVDNSGNLWLLCRPFVNKCGYDPYYFGSSGPKWRCYESPVLNGLVKFDGKRWSVYNTLNSGLPSNLVYTAAAGDSGHIWVGTDKGLALFDADYVDAIDRGPLRHAEPGGGKQISIHIRNGMVSLHALSSNIVSAVVFDAAGKWVQAVHGAFAGHGKTVLSLARLPAGFYIARINILSPERHPAVVQQQFVVPGN